MPAAADTAKCRGGNARCRWRRESPRRTAPPIRLLSPRSATSRSGTTFWARKRVLARFGRRGLRSCLPFQVLAVQTDKIDGVEHQRREAAVTYGRRDDFACEREQQARALDHHQRMQVFLRHVRNAEDAGIGEIEAEHDL